jgi:uncharacterized protein YjiS (DUF1127 family)
MTTDDIAASAPGSILTESGSPTVIQKVKPLLKGSPIGRLRSIIRIWVARHRDRQELLNLLDQDHRIAQDMGTTEHELRAWIRKPFWLP